MATPRFSIVIPTRQRHETLEFAIRTVLAQRFTNYEVIVSDNCSSPETQEVVSRIRDPRIRYFRTEMPVSMVDSWEFALGHVRGEYILVMGDDDGLMPYALFDIDKIIAMTQYEIIRWERIYYTWPSISLKCYANQLTIPLVSYSRRVSGRQVMLPIAHGKKIYTTLPMLYNSAINRTLIETLRNKTGRVFRSISPDIYSGFAFAYLSTNYLSIGKPMSINGGSAKSLGYSFGKGNERDSIVRDALELYKRSNLHFHYAFPWIMSLISASAEAFQQSKEALFPHDNSLKLDRKYVFKKMLKELQANNPDEIETSIDLIKRSLQNDKNIQRWINKWLSKNHVPIKPDINSKPKYQTGFNYHSITLDASEFGANDVLGASILADKIIGNMTFTLDVGRKDIGSRLNKLFQQLKRMRAILVYE